MQTLQIAKHEISLKELMYFIKSIERVIDDMREQDIITNFARLQLDPNYYYRKTSIGPLIFTYNYNNSTNLIRKIGAEHYYNIPKFEGDEFIMSSDTEVIKLGLILLVNILNKLKNETS